MSTASLFITSAILFIFIFNAESVYNVYTYDDGDGNDEHCCVVRKSDKFCLATPITRSLIQFNKQCHRFDRSMRRQYGQKSINNQYLSKISRRLPVKRSVDLTNKVLIQLRDPLEKTILNSDLLCLTSSKTQINLEKCFVELTTELDNDLNNENSLKTRMKKRRNHGRRHFRRQKRVLDEDSEKNNEYLNETVKRISQVELNRPINIQEGKGLSSRQTYKVNSFHIRPKTSFQRRCWSWFRHRVRKNLRKKSKTCVELNDYNEKCLQQLVFNSSTNRSKYEPHRFKRLSVPMGSSLYCEKQNGFNKLLGFHHRSKVCFQSSTDIFIEHTFTDISGMSDARKNSDTLEIISKNSKLQAEFDDDCHSKIQIYEEIDPNEELQTKIRVQ